jgi:hypothetical protein
MPLRRYAAKPRPLRPEIINIHVEDDGVAETGVARMGFVAHVVLANNEITCIVDADGECAM